jgi:hypothetical protein
MTSRSVKGYRVKQTMVDGKLQITVEKIPGWKQDTSAQIRQRKSKRVRVQSPGFSGLFTAKKG